MATADVLSPLSLILSLIDRHAAIGAKVSNGYGVARFYENRMPVQVHMLESLPSHAPPPRRHTLPDIRDFFFAQIQFQAPASNPDWWQNIRGIAEAWNGQVTQGSQVENVYHLVDHNRNRRQRDRARSHLQNVVQEGLLPLAPTIRNWLRFEWLPTQFRSGQAPRALERYLFGYTSQQESIASKVNISHAYRLDNGDWEPRVWGWIPCQAPGRVHLNRDQFLDDLQITLTNAATWQWVFGGRSPSVRLVEWHAVDCMQHDGTAYLRELLGLNQGGTN